jgi:hypothetical protein
MASESDVIFNMIDVGTYFDIAVQVFTFVGELLDYVLAYLALRVSHLLSTKRLCSEEHSKRPILLTSSRFIAKVGELIIFVPFVEGVNFYLTGTERGPCLLCINDDGEKEIVEKMRPEVITSLNDLLWIPRDKNPTGQSNYFLCSMAANVMVMSFIQWFEYIPEDSFAFSCFVVDILPRLMGKEVPTRSIWWCSTFEVVKWEMQRTEGCRLCEKLK